MEHKQATAKTFKHQPIMWKRWCLFILLVKWHDLT